VRQPWVIPVVTSRILKIREVAVVVPRAVAAVVEAARSAAAQSLMLAQSLKLAQSLRLAESQKLVKSLTLA
jgi:hypothetical protein